LLPYYTEAMKMNPVDNADDSFQDFPFSMYSMHPSLATTICVNKHEYVFLAKSSYGYL
jgi:hypothetical protein